MPLKHFYFLFTAIVVFCDLNAQDPKDFTKGYKSVWYYDPFPEKDSMEWSVFYSNGDTSKPDWNYWVYYKTLGDTQINQYKYKKVYKNSFFGKYLPSDTLVCFYRQDTLERQVMVRSAATFYNDTNEYVVMDFKLNKYDTVEYPIYTKKQKFELKRFYVSNIDSSITYYPGFYIYGRLTYGLKVIDTTDLYQLCYRTTKGVQFGCFYPKFGFIEGLGSVLSGAQTSFPFIFPCHNHPPTYAPISKKYAIDTIADVKCLRIKDSLLFVSQINNGCGRYVLAIQKIESVSSNLSVYPNPCNDYILIQGLPILSILTIQMFDNQGREVKQTHCYSGHDVRLNTDALDNGIYYLSIQTTTENFSFKIIKY